MYVPQQSTIMTSPPFNTLSSLGSTKSSITAASSETSLSNTATSSASATLSPATSITTANSSASVPNSSFPTNALTVASSSSLSTSSPMSTTVPFFLNFTITNLNFSLSLNNASSALYKNVSATIASLIDNIFVKSPISSYYVNSSVLGFSPAKKQPHTTVRIILYFRPSIEKANLQSADIYETLKNFTNNFQTLGDYKLDPNSVFVDGYQTTANAMSTTAMMTTTTTATNKSSTATTVISTNVPTWKPGYVMFTVQFRIINRNFSQDLSDPKTSLYKQMAYNITIEITVLFTNSYLSSNFKYVTVTNFRKGSVIVGCSCVFSPGSDVNSTAVKNIFAEGTNSTNLLGGLYQLDPNSLFVEEVIPVVQLGYSFPFWAIIILSLLIFLIMCLLGMFLYMIIMNRWYQRTGSYHIMPPPKMMYYSHIA
ncbi:mucin-16-like [Erpetoichthys calabaricus]|uniref:mucin-16-like n=1 Tax=Erpetoichthys calabaricus TaxID=27687 RepID=UPI0022344660|nr:mucin-16-like [Erpetoichthys calabaricus]